MRRFSLLFLAAAFLSDAQKLPEPYLSIVELAHSAPPEFAADAMLRVVESGKIADIILLDGNPLEGYWNWLKTKVTIKGGVVVVDKRAAR